MTAARIETHLPVEQADRTAADLLTEASGLSKQRIKQAMKKGAVWLERGPQVQRLRRATKPLRAGDTLHLYYDEQILASEPPVPELIADHQGYSLWYKPCGLLSQGSKWSDHGTLHRWAEQHLSPQRPAFVVHRLDRAATGLMLLAHEKGIAAQLSRLFQQRAIDKRYRVIVRGNFSAQPDPLEVNTEIDGRSARSRFQWLQTLDGLSLIDVTIETGRKHQIRRHLAGLGFPVVGDRLYGGGEEVDLQLTAYRLAFPCPLSDQPRDFELAAARLPDLSQVAARLRS